MDHAPYTPRFIVRTLGKGLRQAAPVIGCFLGLGAIWMAAYWLGMTFLPIDKSVDRFLIAYPLAFLVSVLVALAVMYVRVEAKREIKKGIR